MIDTRGDLDFAMQPNKRPVSKLCCNMYAVSGSTEDKLIRVLWVPFTILMQSRSR